jgi:hypothetical protein
MMEAPAIRFEVVHDRLQPNIDLSSRSDQRLHTSRADGRIAS